MAEDLSNKIMQIIDLLGKDNVMSMLSSIGGNSGGKSSEPPAASGELEPGSEIDPEIFSGASKAMTVNSESRKAHDNRLALLNSLHPFMGAGRQKKLDSIMKVMNVAMMVGLLDKKE